MSEDGEPMEAAENTNFKEKGLLALTRKWHDEFDKKWGEISFHNAEHIRATREAAERYLNKMTSENDPIGVLAGLEKWNSKQSSEHKVSLEKFTEAVVWAVECHDLGNIMTGVRIDGNSTMPIYHADNKYKAKGAEARSMAIAENMIQASDMNEEKRNKISPLVQHLIKGTIFVADAEDELHSYMEIMDQIGNDMFSNNEERVGGIGSRSCS